MAERPKRNDARLDRLISARSPEGKLQRYNLHEVRRRLLDNLARHGHQHGYQLGASLNLPRPIILEVLREAIEDKAVTCEWRGAPEQRPSGGDVSLLMCIYNLRAAGLPGEIPSQGAT